jgi:hypothetical protein
LKGKASRLWIVDNVLSGILPAVGLEPALGLGRGLERKVKIVDGNRAAVGSGQGFVQSIPTVPRWTFLPILQKKNNEVKPVSEPRFLYVPAEVE